MAPGHRCDLLLTFELVVGFGTRWVFVTPGAVVARCLTGGLLRLAGGLLRLARAVDGSALGGVTMDTGLVVDRMDVPGVATVCERDTATGRDRGDRQDGDDRDEALGHGSSSLFDFPQAPIKLGERR